MYIVRKTEFKAVRTDEIINIEKDWEVKAKKSKVYTEKDCVKRARTIWRDNKYQERQQNKERETSLNSKNAKEQG